MTSKLKALVRKCTGNYELYRIYTADSTTAELYRVDELRFSELSEKDRLNHAMSNEVRGSFEYAGNGAVGFGAWKDGELVSACWLWAGERYKQRNFWPLKNNEAKLVQIVTAQAQRGQGIATRLIRFTTAEMISKGYSRLYARVWHSNRPSAAAFERAGWRYIAFVVKFWVLGRSRPVHWTCYRTGKSQ